MARLEFEFVSVGAKNVDNELNNIRTSFSNVNGLLKDNIKDDEFTYEGNFEEEGITESFINAVCINKSSKKKNYGTKNKLKQSFKRITTSSRCD